MGKIFLAFSFFKYQPWRFPRSQDGGTWKEGKVLHLVFFSPLAAFEHKWLGVNTVSHLRSEAARKACDAGAWNKSLWPREGLLFCITWCSLNPLLCPFSIQVLAETVNWLRDGVSFPTSVPRHRGLMPPLSLPTGAAWNNLQSQGPLFGDKTEPKLSTPPHPLPPQRNP